jgi:hypothetical protein
MMLRINKNYYIQFDFSPSMEMLNSGWEIKFSHYYLPIFIYYKKSLL